MPKSSTECFARTYTPRAPDDSYDSLGTTAITTLVQAPLQKSTKIQISAAFSYGSLYQVVKESGAKAGVRLTNSFSKGLLQSQAIKAPAQRDAIKVSATLSGGTLKIGS